ncbi:MAG TPA: TerC family protein [Verrucomicrobiae bacterium]|jgi:tellurite resistance protein TerC
MFAVVEITAWHWAGFVAFILVFLALDLGVFHRHAREVRFKEAGFWTVLLTALALAFAGALFLWRGADDALEYLTGYIIELSLSMDNVFVIALIFAFFRVPAEYQHRVLFWGILGALLMRGIMIGAGAALVSQAHWVLYIFGGFLIYTGIRMAFSKDEGVHPESNPVIKAARKLYPVTLNYEGQKFLVRQNGRRMLTPLALVLLMVETTDLIFALDSIPAIFAVTQKPFIIFTSNVFAILGLRSLYFILAGAIRYFRYLKAGLSIVLAFIGIKMLCEMWHWKIPTHIALIIVLLILLGSMVLSALAASREKDEPAPPGKDEVEI